MCPVRSPLLLPSTPGRKTGVLKFLRFEKCLGNHMIIVTPSLFSKSFPSTRKPKAGFSNSSCLKSVFKKFRFPDRSVCTEGLTVKLTLCFHFFLRGVEGDYFPREKAGKPATRKGNNTLNFPFELGQLVHLKTEANLCASQREANPFKFFADCSIFKLGSIKYIFKMISSKHSIHNGKN